MNVGRFDETMAELNYPIIEVPANAAWAEEQMGSKAKFWYINDRNQKLLFKIPRANTGEDWSEKIASELAELLGIPHARYDLAICGDQVGTVTGKFHHDDSELIHGNEILVQIDPDYPASIQQRKKFSRVRQHTLAAVLDVVSMPKVHPPLGWESFENALTVFAGYIVFDAWIGNTDRHHENWGLIFHQPSRKFYLAPTFDHASSMGAHLTDLDRARRLSTRDQAYSVAAYSQRAISAFYNSIHDSRPMTTRDAFVEARQRCPEGVGYWLARLQSIDSSDIRSRFAGVPRNRISATASEFATMLLLENQRYLLTGLGK